MESKPNSIQRVGQGLAEEWCETGLEFWVAWEIWVWLEFGYPFSKA
jgi:hypothetical protein